MPSFSKSLESAIHQALALANERRHELATLEHLLLSLISEPDAAKVMQACSVDLEQLRATLIEFIDEELATLVTDVEGSEAVPTAAFPLSASAMRTTSPPLSTRSSAGWTSNISVPLHSSRRAAICRAVPTRLVMCTS